MGSCTLEMIQQFFLYYKPGFPHTFTALAAQIAVAPHLAKVAGTPANAFPQLAVGYILTQTDIHDGISLFR